MRRRSGGTVSTGDDRTSPLTVIVPASGVRNPAISRSVVVFPHPEGPRSVTNSFSSMAMSMPDSARKEPKFLLSPWISIWAMPRL